MLYYVIGAMSQLVFLKGRIHSLFTLYINDLPLVVNLYANDAELHYSHSDVHTVESYIQTDLDAVELWLPRN